MPGELVPELHDIGKLIDNEAVNADMPGLGLDHHYFTTRNQEQVIDWRRWEMTTPRTLSWLGIVGHNNRLIRKSTQIGTPPAGLSQLGLPLEPENMAQLLKLVMADHLAASKQDQVKIEVTPLAAT
ncbi:MAG: hypothetical protein DRI40_05140 [Chloroflexi bacterium]|nr:MAG: hypothetical protein DRI40_05140 [Chloroflexota bacterium]